MFCEIKSHVVFFCRNNDFFKKLLFINLFIFTKKNYATIRRFKIIKRTERNDLKNLTSSSCDK